MNTLLDVKKFTNPYGYVEVFELMEALVQENLMSEGSLETLKHNERSYGPVNAVIDENGLFHYEDMDISDYVSGDRLPNEELAPYVSLYFITNHFLKGEEWRKGPDVVVPGAYRLHFETTTSFDELKTSVKTFETLEYNRDYQLDDFISFRDKLTGKSVMKRITYLLTDQPYVPYGYVILGLKDDEITMPY